MSMRTVLSSSICTLLICGLFAPHVLGRSRLVCQDAGAALRVAQVLRSISDARTVTCIVAHRVKFATNTRGSTRDLRTDIRLARPNRLTLVTSVPHAGTLCATWQVGTTLWVYDKANEIAEGETIDGDPVWERCYATVAALFVMALFFSDSEHKPVVLKADYLTDVVLGQQQIRARVSVAGVVYTVLIDTRDSKLVEVARDGEATTPDVVTALEMNRPISDEDLGFTPPSSTVFRNLDVRRGNREVGGSTDAVVFQEDVSRGGGGCSSFPAGVLETEESRALGQLQSLSGDQARYMRVYGEYGSLNALMLATALDGQRSYACREVGNYRLLFELSTDRQHFRVSALPIVYGDRGRRTFMVDDGGLIYCADLGGRPIENVNEAIVCMPAWR